MISSNKTYSNKEGYLVPFKNLDKDAVERDTGYRMKTDLYRELSIAESLGGEKGVQKLADVYINLWLGEVTLYTELVLILEMKKWFHSGCNSQYVNLYGNLRDKAYRKGLSYYKGEAISYFTQMLE